MYDSTLLGIAPMALNSVATSSVQKIDVRFCEIAENSDMYTDTSGISVLDAMEQ
jgi:hypothetical protein